MALKEIFQCEEVEIVQLGLFTFGKSCLPEISIYYNSEVGRRDPRVLGIITDPDCIQFIDKSGDTILTLKPIVKEGFSFRHP